MSSDSDIVSRVIYHPFSPLIPMACMVVVLAITLAGIHLFLVFPAEKRVANLEGDWTAARDRLVHHREAKKIRDDLTQVLAVFPAQEDFVPLALGITDEAKRNRVGLPSLSYQVEPQKGELATKAFFRGAVKGRYEDLRRFIHQLEVAEELLFIEDLDVARSGGQQRDPVTFNMRIATYLRR